MGRPVRKKLGRPIVKRPTVRARSLAMFTFNVVTFIDGFVKFNFDTQCIFLLQNVWHFPIANALQFFHALVALYYVGVAVTLIALRNVETTYGLMIFFESAFVLLLGAALILEFFAFPGMHGKRNFVSNTLTAGRLLIAALSATTSFIYGAKFVCMKRVCYEQYNYPKEKNEYFENLWVSTAAQYAGRISGVILINITNTGTRRNRINYHVFSIVLFSVSVIELENFLWNQQTRNRSPLRILTAMLIVGRAFMKKIDHSHRRPTDLKTLVQMGRKLSFWGAKKESETPAGRLSLLSGQLLKLHALPLYIPVTVLMGFRQQKGSQFAFQAERLNLRVYDTITVHPSVISIFHPITFLAALFPFKWLLKYTKDRGHPIRTYTRTLLAFIFIAASVISSAILEVFIDDSEWEKIPTVNQLKGSIVVYNSVMCPGFVETGHLKNVFMPPFSHSQMLSSETYDIIDEDNKTLKVEMTCDDAQLTASITMNIEGFYLHEYLIIQEPNRPSMTQIEKIRLIELEPRSLNVDFLIQNTYRIVYSAPDSSHFDVTIEGLRPGESESGGYRRLQSGNYSTEVDVLGIDRYAVAVNGMFLNELTLSGTGQAITLLLSRSNKRYAIPMTEIITLNEPNAISILYQIPQIVFQGLADLMVESPGFIYANNIFGSEWRESLQFAWYLSQAVGNIYVVIWMAFFAFERLVYNYLIAVYVTLLSIIFFVEIIRRFFKTDNEKTSVSTGTLSSEYDSNNDVPISHSKRI